MSGSQANPIAACLIRNWRGGIRSGRELFEMGCQTPGTHKLFAMRMSGCRIAFPPLNRIRLALVAEREKTLVNQTSLCYDNAHITMCL